MTENKDAWGYVRLSQEGRDTSLDQQKADIREYARENDLNLQTTRNDGKNTSGFDKGRDEYQLLRKKIRNGEIDAVIVRDRARLSRDFDDRLQLVTEFRSTGVELHVVEAGGRVHLEDVQNAGMECLHAMMGHVKKMAEIQRSRDVVEERIENGCYQGSAPIGLQFADDGCHLEKSDRWDDIETAFAMIQNGRARAEIADETGIAPWTVSQMKKRGISWYEEKLQEYGIED